MFQNLAELTEKRFKHQMVPLGIISNGPFIDRAYREALDHMYDRELVMNAIEAGATDITITPDWEYIDECTRESKPLVYRYTVVDNGIGMTDAQLVSFFNNLSASGHDLSGEEATNFGMGAKISLLPWNKEGLIIMSWHKDNPAGSMIRIVKRPSDKNYGLFLWRDEDDLFQKTAVPPVNYKERFLPDSETGTIVIALGNSPDEDTFLGPTYKGEVGAPTSPTHARFLNNRFYEIPENVNIRVIHFNKAEKSFWPKSEIASESNGMLAATRVRGTKSFIDKLSIDSGNLALTDATLHWWILDPDEKPLLGRPQYNNTFVGVVYGKELYNVTGYKDRSLYNKFGIVFEEVKKRLVILVEPNKEAGLYYPNTPRSSLIYSDSETKELPWQRWGLEFIENIPKQIKDLNDRYTGGFDTPKRSIKDRLKDFFARLNPETFQKIKNSQTFITVASFIPMQGLQEKADSSTKVKELTDTLPKIKLDTGVQTPVKKITAKTEPPKPIWVKAADMSEEHYAAEYINAGNIVKINEDFFLFKEVTQYWSDKYTDVLSGHLKVKEAVRDIYQLKLVSCIMQAYAMGTKPEWANSWTKLLTPEALTSTMLGLINEHACISQRLSGLGVKKKEIHKE